MRLYSKYILFLIFAICSFQLTAQDDDDDEDQLKSAKESGPLAKQFYVFSPRINVTVPHPIANKSFRKSFLGIYEVSGGMDIMLYKGIFVGGSYKNGLLKITENKIANYNASMEINNAGGKIGCDAYLGENNRVLFSGAITAGKNWTSLYGFVSKDPKNPPKGTMFTTSFMEPEVDLYFLIESNFGIGATITYTIFNHNFDPEELRLTDWATFNTDNSKQTQYLSFGFGFYYGFLQKKKQK